MNLGILNGAYPPPRSETPRILFEKFMWEAMFAVASLLVGIILAAIFYVAAKLIGKLLGCAFWGGVYVFSHYAAWWIAAFERREY